MRIWTIRQCWIINKSAHVLVVYCLKVIYLIRRELLFVTLSGSPEPSESSIQLAYAFFEINLNAMDVNKSKITDVFSGNRQYVIPFFQRAYVWWEEQWERLLIDMEHVTEVQRQYFLGSINIILVIIVNIVNWVNNYEI